MCIYISYIHLGTLYTQLVHAYMLSGVCLMSVSLISQHCWDEPWFPGSLAIVITRLLPYWTFQWLPLASTPHLPHSHRLHVLSHIYSVGPTKKKPALTANAMIDIPCWLGQEIGDFPTALSRKLLAQLSWMGQNSLRHGNNFLDAAGCSLRTG